MFRDRRSFVRLPASCCNKVVWILASRTISRSSRLISWSTLESMTSVRMQKRRPAHDYAKPYKNRLSVRRRLFHSNSQSVMAQRTTKCSQRWPRLRPRLPIFAFCHSKNTLPHTKSAVRRLLQRQNLFCPNYSTIIQDFPSKFFEASLSQ